MTKIKISAEFDDEDGYASGEKQAVAMLNSYKYRILLFEIGMNLTSHVERRVSDDREPTAQEVYETIADLFEEYDVGEQELMN